MKHLTLKQYALLIVLALVLSACSAPGENGSSSNTNSSPQSNSNSATQPSVAENGTPTAISNAPPPAVQQIPAPQPADKAAAPPNSNSVAATPAANPRAPKLVVPSAKIDYGKQDQGKTLIRAIAIRNGGKSDLNIEQVVPG